MKSTQYDPETNKEYSYENEYDLKIQIFMESSDFLFFYEEVVEYAISLKSEIISELDKKNSNSDKIRVEHIKWIVSYLKDVHEFLIEHKMEIYPNLESIKPFKYSTSKKSPGRPKGSRNKLTVKKRNWIRDRYVLVNKGKRIKNLHTDKEYAGWIHSILLEKKPSFWTGKIYSTAYIHDIIKKRLWEK